MSDSITLAQARAYIEQLDLSYIVTAMCAPTYPLPRWTHAAALHCQQLYKNYLLLLKMHHPENLVPTREIDEFWHNHILYTKKYLHDCLQIFGHYLHHEPADPNDNPQDLVAAFVKTKEYYLAAFNCPLALVNT